MNKVQTLLLDFMLMEIFPSALQHISQKQITSAYWIRVKQIIEFCFKTQGLFYPSAVDWMEADLNARKGQGLKGQNDWRSLAPNYDIFIQNN